jgi:hypothetical protein
MPRPWGQQTFSIRPTATRLQGSFASSDIVVAEAVVHWLRILLLDLIESDASLDGNVSR